MKVNAAIRILTITLIKPSKQKPDSHYDKQACGDWQNCMEKAQHFKIFSNYFWNKILIAVQNK